MQPLTAEVFSARLAERERPTDRFSGPVRELRWQGRAGQNSLSVRRADSPARTFYRGKISAAGSTLTDAGGQQRGNKDAFLYFEELTAAAGRLVERSEVNRQARETLREWLKALSLYGLSMEGAVDGAVLRPPAPSSAWVPLQPGVVSVGTFQWAMCSQRCWT